MKKHISLALSVIMLLTTLLSTSVFAAYSDVTDDLGYYEAITMLSKLNVINGYEDGTFKPDGNITRAEFTKIVTYTLGLGDLKTPPTEFSDVNDHWAKFNIKTAYDQGIINGMGDGTFAPDANVTYEQALKMVVCMLGYKTYAEQAGGYPVGYRAQAAALKITDNITGVSYDAPATRGSIAQLMYNALEVPMMTVNALGNVVSANETLLNDRLNVIKLEGILVGAEEYLTADCTNTLNLWEMSVLGKRNEGEIVIDFSEYTNSVADISKYLGKLITVYYKDIKTTNERKLVIIDDESSKNAEYHVTFDQIASFDGNKLEYYETSDSKRARDLKFSLDDVTVRYNGKMVDPNHNIVLKKTAADSDGKMVTQESSSMDIMSALREWLNPGSQFFIYGDVKLTDREADGKINDVQINDYNTIVAYKTPTTSDYRITDKLVTGNSITLNPDAVEYSFTIEKNGSQVPVTSIKAGDVVLYAKSLDGSLYTCKVSQKSIKGKITSIESADNKIYVDETEYNLGTMLEKYISTNQDGKQLTTGQSGTFYVDDYNTLVYGTIEDEKTNPYAYITTVYTSDDDSEYFLAAFIPSKASTGTTSYKLREKVKVNGKNMNAAQAASYLSGLSTDETVDGSGYYYNNNDINNSSKKDELYDGATTKLTSAAQLARLEIAADNTIAGIVTVTDDAAAYNTDGTTAITTNEDTSKIVRCKEIAKYKYTSSSFTIGNKTQFSVNSSTTIIYVPGNRSEKTEYAKKSTSSLSPTEEYNVEAYDINSSKVAGLVVIYGTSGSITEVTKTTDYSIIAEIPQVTYDADDDENKLTLSVYAGTSTTAKDWITKDANEFDDVEVGDVIQFAYDQNKRALDRVNVIQYADIKEVINGKQVDVDDHKEVFNWTEAPDDSGSVQKYKFDYRFPKAKPSGDNYFETYHSSTLGDIPYSRAAMYNVYQIQEEGSKLLVTQGGFALDENGEVKNDLYDPEDYEEISITSSTKIIRMESNEKEFSPYVEDTETALTFLDLKAAQNYGSECSKILVCSLQGRARLIVIYD